MAYAIFLKDRVVDLRSVNRIALGKTSRTSFTVEDTTHLTDIFDGGRVGTPDLSKILSFLELNPALSCFIEQENTFTWMKAEIRETE